MAISGIAAVPTLGATPYLTNPQDQIAHYIRQYAEQPRSVSDTFYDEIISLAAVLSANGHDRLAVAVPINRDIRRVLQSQFPGSNISVNVTTEETSASTYVIYLNVVVSIGGVNYAVDPQLTVENGQLVLPTDRQP